MGIYWRQAHQSAPHLINEPKHSVDQEFHTSVLCFCHRLIEFATGIRRNRLCFFFFLSVCAKFAPQKLFLEKGLFIAATITNQKHFFSPWLGVNVKRLFNVFFSSLLQVTEEKDRVRIISGLCSLNKQSISWQLRTYAVGRIFNSLCIGGSSDRAQNTDRLRLERRRDRRLSHGGRSGWSVSVDGAPSRSAERPAPGLSPPQFEPQLHGAHGALTAPGRSWHVSEPLGFSREPVLHQLPGQGHVQPSAR